MIHAAFAIFLLAISPTFWHDLIQQTPVHIVATAVTVTALLKGIRKAFPQVDGRWALLMNVVLSIAGVFVGMQPANVFSETTLVQLLVIISSAGGWHSIWNAIVGKPDEPAKTDKPGAGTIPISQGNTLPLAAGALFLACLGLGGCIHAPAAATGATAPSIYQNGAQAMNDFSKDLLSAQSVVSNIHAGGAIDDVDYRQIQAQFANIAGYGVQIDALINAQASAVTITARITSAIDSLGAIAINASGLDAPTTAKVNAGIQALKLLLTNLLPIFAPSVSLWAHSPHPLEVAFGPDRNRYAGRAGSRPSPADLQPGQGRAARPDWHNYPEADRRAYG